MSRADAGSLSLSVFCSFSVASLPHFLLLHLLIDFAVYYLVLSLLSVHPAYSSILGKTSLQIIYCLSVASVFLSPISVCTSLLISNFCRFAYLYVYQAVLSVCGSDFHFFTCLCVFACLAICRFSVCFVS